ncbi:hypothetical protein GDO81_028752, partial [Engystomops pustulosus]
MFPGYRILNPDLLVKIERSDECGRSRGNSSTSGGVLVPDILLKIQCHELDGIITEMTERRPEAESGRGGRARKPERPIKIKQENNSCHSKTESEDRATSPAPHNLVVVVKQEDEQDGDEGMAAQEVQSEQQSEDEAEPPDPTT